MAAPPKYTKHAVCFHPSPTPKATYSKQKQLHCKPRGPTTSSNAVTTDCAMHKHIYSLQKYKFYPPKNAM